jgi:hypothetical protein
METFRFAAPVIYWRGPAPHLFARIPEPTSGAIAVAGHGLSYGWGCIPVRARIAGVEFSTALIPKDGVYLLPLKLAVRRPLALEQGDEVEVEMTLGGTGG